MEPENPTRGCLSAKALMVQGRDADAVPELMMALQLRSEAGPHSGEQAAAEAQGGLHEGGAAVP